VDDYAPAWSPDGTELVYVSELGGDSEICVLTVDTPAPLCTSNAHDDHSPDWRGNVIVYYAEPGGQDAEIFTLPENLSAAPTPLTDNSVDDEDPRWAPDGRIVFSRASANGPHDIWRMDANGGNPTNITLGSPYNDREPAVSPDGRMFAFVSNRSGSERLWLAEWPNGSNPVPQLTPPPNARHPRWKP
jgi:Tol biopolymer transport system component